MEETSNMAGTHKGGENLRQCLPAVASSLHIGEGGDEGVQMVWGAGGRGLPPNHAGVKAFTVKALK